MKTNFSLVKLTLCGPKDVSKEIAIAQEVIDEWNLAHGEAKGFWVKYQHWSTDSHPELGDRPQEVINRQLIDEADILVAVFWSRFGTPTGVAGSGTEEEIRRGARLGRKVMVYFSDLEPIPADADQSQLERLWVFRQELLPAGLCWRFGSRDQFRKEFTRHLALKLNEFNEPESQIRESAPSQSIVGDNNVQAGRDLNMFSRPPVIKHVIERRPGSVSSQELRQIKSWIEDLADGEVGMTRKSAFGKWGAIFLNTFGLVKREEFSSAQMPEAQRWFIQQRAIQTREQKSKAPENWLRQRFSAIKAAMNEMQLTNETYYPELARRLRMKKPFSSLKDLTKRDVDRVYNLVLRDRRELKGA